MPAKKLIILIFTLLFLSLIGYGVYVWSDMRNVQQSGQTPSLKDYFPFGVGGKTVTTPPQDQGTTTEVPPTETTTTTETTTPPPRLVKITDGPVAGYAIIQKQVIPDEESLQPKKEDEVVVTPRGVFTKELKLGTRDESVKRLQQTLNDCPDLGIPTTGPESRGKETTLFTDRTENAVRLFQSKFGVDILEPQNLTKPTGVVDALTQKKLSSPFICYKKTAFQPIVIKDTVRYVERGTGNIFDHILDTGKEVRVTNTTIPRIQEAFVVNNGSQVVLRYLRDDNKTIESYAGTIPSQPLTGDTADTNLELKGVFMPANIVDIAVSPDTLRLYTETITTSGARGSILTNPTGKPTDVFSNPYTEWISQWVNQKTITLTTKASGFVPGYLYKLNTDTQVVDKVLGGVYGLTTNMSPDGKYILYSQSTSSGIQSLIYNTVTRKVVSLGIITLPEKCVWNKTSTYIYCAGGTYLPDDVYPDAWYQGTESFNDYFWRIDPTRLLGDQKIFDPITEGGETTDGVSLKIDPNEQYLTFTNKIDGSLWKYKLNP